MEMIQRLKYSLYEQLLIHNIWKARLRCDLLRSLDKRNNNDAKERSKVVRIC